MSGDQTVERYWATWAAAGWVRLVAGPMGAAGGGADGVLLVAVRVAGAPTVTEHFLGRV